VGNERFDIQEKNEIVYCGKKKILIFAQSNKQNDRIWILYLKNRNGKRKAYRSILLGA
jgi:phage tail sheath gpL-like